ncbi:MAG: hypothetical protein JXL97_19455 [Bacteroidales bacterium]|nr:hypothetical protein [Bacteroidales bacterium]
MSKIPDISCEIEKTQFDKKAQGAFVDYLKITQNEKNVEIIQKKFDPYEQKETIEELSGKIIAFDKHQKFAKIKQNDGSFRWFDYDKKTFDMSRLEKFFYFKINNFKYNNATLNTLIKFMNIAVSVATIEGFAFFFIDSPEIKDNLKIQNSKVVKGYSATSKYYKSEDYKELRMTLNVPATTIFDVEIGVNFLDYDQGYVRLLGLNEISKIIFDKILRFFMQNHNFTVVNKK